MTTGIASANGRRGRICRRNSPAAFEDTVSPLADARAFALVWTLGKFPQCARISPVTLPLTDRRESLLLLLASSEFWVIARLEAFALGFSPHAL